MDKFEGYNKPWIMRRADPYVYRHTDGSYYFTASLPEYDGIALRRADSLYLPSFTIWTANGTSILPAATRMISGRFGHMCWSAAEKILCRIRG